MQIHAAFTCRVKIKLGGRDPAARRGRRDEADVSPTHAPPQTLLQTSRICLPSRRRLQLGLETPFKERLPSVLYHLLEKPGHTSAAIWALPWPCLAPARDPGTEAGAGSTGAVPMCPGQTPAALAPARAVGTQHITEQVLSHLWSRMMQETRDFQGKMRHRGFHFAEGLQAHASSGFPTPPPALPGGWGGSEATVPMARRVLSGAGGDAWHQLCDGHRQAHGRAGRWLQGLGVQIPQSSVLCFQTQHFHSLPCRPGGRQVLEACRSPYAPVTARGYCRNPRRDGTIHEPR